MKRNLLSLVLLAMIALSVNAQVIAEIDWTQRSEYLDLWYSDLATVSVEQGTGLIIDCLSDGTGKYWEPMVPMIGHIDEINEGGQYLVKFTAQSPVDGKLRLDFCSWDGTGATLSKIIDVTTGIHEYNVDFEDYPTKCTDAQIFYQCGKLPGRHIIKNVQLMIKEKIYDPLDICYNYVAKGKIAEVINNPDKKYYGKVEIPSKVIHDGIEYTVTKINDNTFKGCSGLTSVTIPNSVTSIGESAFNSCSGLTSVIIPNSVTSIGRSAFENCTGLTSVTIPNSVTSIGSSAFYNCRSLTSVTIPNSVTTIGSSAFWYCTSLTSVIIPNSVTSIGDNAFYGCSSLTSLTIPNSLTSIGGSVFYGCSGLTSVTIPNSVTSIGSGAFQRCSSLTAVTIPNSVTTIGGYAFKGCSNLSSVTIGENVSRIYSSSFANCQLLADVYCLAENVPNTNIDAFMDSYINYSTLHVPAASLDKYKNAEPWKNFKNKVALGGADIPVTQKCAKPTITYNNGVITFSCETEGAEFISEVKANDNKKEYDNKIILSNTYTVSVYATKPGYDNSETVTMEVVGSVGKLGDLTGDGKVDVADHVKLSEIIMNQ